MTRTVAWADLAAVIRQLVLERAEWRLLDSYPLPETVRIEVDAQEHGARFS